MRAGAPPNRRMMRAAGDRLAAAALADQAEDFAAADIELDAVDGAQLAIAVAEDGHQIGDGKKAFHRRQPFGRSRLSRPSPTRVKAMPV